MGANEQVQGPLFTGTQALRELTVISVGDLIYIYVPSVPYSHNELFVLKCLVLLIYIDFVIFVDRTAESVHSYFCTHNSCFVHQYTISILTPKFN